MSDAIVYSRWAPGHRGKGIITFQADRPSDLHLFKAPLDEHGHDTLVTVDGLCRYLEVDYPPPRGAVVRIETENGRDLFWIDDVDRVSPSEADAKLIDWVLAKEPRITWGGPKVYDDPALWEDS
jgi:hypothetical protein